MVMVMVMVMVECAEESANGRLSRPSAPRGCPLVLVRADRPVIRRWAGPCPALAGGSPAGKTRLSHFRLPLRHRAGGPPAKRMTRTPFPSPPLPSPWACPAECAVGEHAAVVEPGSDAEPSRVWIRGMAVRREYQESRRGRRPDDG